MIPPWLHALSIAALALGGATAVLITLDLMRHPQSMRIMNLVWPVTGLYAPVIGWWLYRALGRPHAVDAPARTAERPRWQSIVLSATHCGSGCVIGDVIGAPIVFATGWSLLGERLFAEYVVEFAIAYPFGIAFQYFPIRAMRGAAPLEALIDAVKADTLSLAAFEFGMFGWMAVTNFLLFAAHRPSASSSVFWFVMQLGMICGFLTTYPANWLLVKWGIKEGM